jgi:TetR/AcrR family transcriptional regulator, ethionamide resistance regulator
MSGHDLTHGPEARRTAGRPRRHAGSAAAETTILDAAERRLSTIPLHQLSVADIIREASISRATFYFYFSSKFAVVTALVARVMDELRAVLEPVADRPGDESLDEWIGRWVRAAVEVWLKHGPVLRATVESWHAIPELRSLWVGVIEQTAELIGARILVGEKQNGPLDPVTRERAAVLAWSMERILYVAGLEVSDQLPDERAIVPLITRMLVVAADRGDQVCNTSGK